MENICVYIFLRMRVDTLASKYVCIVLFFGRARIMIYTLIRQQFA